MIAKGDDPLLFENLHFTLTSDESKQINADNKSKVIISASGMCEAGRIKHHLKHNLWRRESSVVFVGYQAPGTLGHTLKTGARKVRIFGEEIAVKSKIYSVEGFSSHADLDGLVKWIDSNGKLPDKIILIHGEKEGMEKLKNTLTDKFGKEVLIPEMGDTVELTYSREVIDHQELISMEEASKEKMLAELYDLIESVEKGHVKNVDKAMEDIKKLKELIS
jgi:metallo-beta-lactamase family protein